MSTYTVTTRSASEALPYLAQEIMKNGALIGSRAGATREILYPHITLTEPWKREILTPGRHADILAQIAETAWVLDGRADVEWLSRYLPRAAEFSDDGLVWRAGYGPRLRNWLGVDQIREITDLLKQDNGTRRAVMSLWDPSQDYIKHTADIPCNNWLHFLIRDGRLNLHAAVRSNDLIWGWSGINAFEWSVLQEIVAAIVGVEVGTLEFSISSLHIYERHFAKAESLSRESFTDAVPGGPRNGFLAIHSIEDLDEDLTRFFACEEMIWRDVDFLDAGRPKSATLRSWLRALAGESESSIGIRLQDAIKERPKPGKSDAKIAFGPMRPDGELLDRVAEMAGKLHAEKHAVYGDSWKKRGEKVSIQANIARKIDRLGKDGAGDTNLDTSVDLLCYLVKYALWLEGENTDGPKHAEDVSWELKALAAGADLGSRTDVGKGEDRLTQLFEKLLRATKSRERIRIVKQMLIHAFRVAAIRYAEAQPTPVAFADLTQ